MGRGTNLIQLISQLTDLLIRVVGKGGVGFSDQIGVRSHHIGLFFHLTSRWLRLSIKFDRFALVFVGHVGIFLFGLRGHQQRGHFRQLHILRNELDQLWLLHDFLHFTQKFVLFLLVGLVHFVREHGLQLLDAQILEGFQTFQLHLLAGQLVGGPMLLLTFL